MKLGRDYENLYAFLTKMYRRVEFFAPYTSTFRLSIFKSVVIFGVFVALPIFTTFMTINGLNETSFTLKLLRITEIVLVVTSGIVCLVWTSCVRKHLQSVHRKLLYVHALFQKKDAPVYSSAELVKHDLAIVTLAIFHATTILDWPWMVKKNSFKQYSIFPCLSFAVPFLSIHYLNSFFRIATHVLAAQVSHMNRQLTFSDPRRPHSVEKLVYGHCLINDAFKLLNASFALPIISMSFCAFFIVVYNLYDMLTFNVEEGSAQTIGDNLEGISWIVMWTSELTVIVVFLEKLIQKHEEFTELLHFSIIHDRTRILSGSIKLQMHIAMKRKLECSAGGFFTVNYELLSTMISKATTYLIILIQVAQVNLGQGKPAESCIIPSNASQSPTQDVVSKT